MQPSEQHQRSVSAHAEVNDHPSEDRLAEAARQRDTSAHRRDDAAEVRDSTGESRDAFSIERDLTADLRARVSDARELAADLRDLAADRRDQMADLRDRVAEEAEARTRPAMSRDALARLRRARAEAAADRRGSADDRLFNASDRGLGAGHRGAASLDRSASMKDRGAGGAERRSAKADRRAALIDRDASAADRDAASLDELTGAYRRGPGFVELERDLARAVRLRESLAVVFLDVDHLKVVNDSRGHAAGDQLLIHVASVLRKKLRSYDIVIRYGGDEFLCVMCDTSTAAANVRLAEVNRLLHMLDQDCSVSFGVSQRRDGDDAQDLVRRADEALYRGRGLNR